MHVPSTETVDRAIGVRLRATRLEHDMTLGELAQVIGVTEEEIEDYEQRSSQIAAISLSRLLRHLRVDTEAWFEDVQRFVRQDPKTRPDPDLAGIPDPDRQRARKIARLRPELRDAAMTRVC